MAKKEITDGRDLKGRKIAGSSPGGSATLLAKFAMKHFGLDADRVSIMPMGGGDASRLAALESGVADATILGIPFNIYAVEKGYSELMRSEEHTSELQSPYDLVCRLLLEKKKENEIV